MIDLSADNLIPMAVVASRFQVRIAAVKRWVQHGIRIKHTRDSVRLDAQLVGCKWFTTQEAVNAFSAALTRQSLGLPVEKTVPADIAKRVERARAAMKAKAPQSRNRKCAPCQK